jgi:3-hydroxyisobutyrate dehydrogenase
MANLPVVAFIGLGQMGYPMAERLAAAGYPLIVHDSDVERTARLAAAHPLRATAFAGSWAAASVVITMLPNSDIVESVLLGDDAAHTIAYGALVVDMSSSEPMRTRVLAAALESRGIQFVDAPVSGGVGRARQGALTIMAGGSVASVERARAVLEQMGSKIFHMGLAGAGHAAKALNNYVSAAGLVAAVEALHAANRFGIDPALLTDVLNASSGRSNTTENKVKQFMLSGSFNSGFALGLMVKDLRIAMNLAKALDQPAPLGAACLALWEQAAALDPKADHTAMYRLLE